MHYTIQEKILRMTVITEELNDIITVPAIREDM